MRAREPALSSRSAALVVGIVILLFGLAAIWEAWHDSVTYDERLYVSSGVATLVHRQIRTNPEHPPLAKVLAALPVLALQPEVPATDAWRQSDQVRYSADFFAAQGSEDRVRAVVFAARMVPIVLAMATAVIAYFVSAALFGRAAGALSAALWLLLPMVLAHAHLDGLDVPLAFVAVAISGVLLVHSRRPSVAWSAVLGGLLGAGLLVKGSGFYFLPGVVAALLVVPCARPRRWWTRAGDAVLAPVVAWAAVWLGVWAVAPVPARLPQTLASIGAPLIGSLPWPDSFRHGLAFQSFYSRVPGPAFLLGEAWTGTRWWYFPGAMVVKTPVSWLAAMAAGVVGWLMLSRREAWMAAVVLGLPVLPFFVLTAAGPRQIGLRYYLPVLAVMAIAAGAAVRLVRGRVALGVASCLLLAQGGWFVEAAATGSLAWTAPGFRPGYRYTTDSNIDWGQDRHELLEFSAGKDVSYWLLSPFFVPPDGRTLDADNVGDVEGWVVVNASSLTAYARDELAFLRAYCPVRLIGGSYLVYRFRDPPSLRPGPVVPAPPCVNATYSSRRAARQLGQTDKVG